MEFNEVRKQMLRNESLFSKYATLDKDAIRLKEINDDIRPNYFRDIDRIIHSLAYSRYMDKTQVFSVNNNDHITRRIIHVNLVSKIARTIGRALGLNEDLIEAASLGHDLGHVPFGHTGEKILNEISLRVGEGYFNHNVQSVRVLMNIENKNITIQVLDAILCHNGELLLKEYMPIKKTINEFLKEIEDTYLIKNYSLNLKPMTLEGCVVRISDIIGYIGRDIDDAISLEMISEEDIPVSITKVLGNTNTKIINTIVNDIISNSTSSIIISEPIWQAINDLKDFNYEYIYNKVNSLEDQNFIKHAFNTLFDYYLENINNSECSINKVFLHNINEEYLNNTSDKRKVIDYLAGMTDDFFINEFRKLSL